MNQEDKLRLLALKNDYRAVFFGTSSAKQGQRVLKDMLQMGGLFKSPMIPGENDRTFANIGRQQMCHEILQMLDVKEYDQIQELERQGLDITAIYEDPYNNKERTS